jgi:hypothetical protein
MRSVDRVLCPRLGEGGSAIPVRCAEGTTSTPPVCELLLGRRA